MPPIKRLSSRRAANSKSTTAKVFLNGASQAVRLPKEFRFDDDEVCIKRIGTAVLLFPKESAWQLLADAMGKADDDFCQRVVNQSAQSGDDGCDSLHARHQYLYRTLAYWIEQDSGSHASLRHRPNLHFEHRACRIAIWRRKVWTASVSQIAPCAILRAHCGAFIRPHRGRVLWDGSDCARAKGDTDRSPRHTHRKPCFGTRRDSHHQQRTRVSSCRWIAH